LIVVQISFGKHYGAVLIKQLLIWNGLVCQKAICSNQRFEHEDKLIEIKSFLAPKIKDIK
jgi:hypothetical protein